MDDERLVHLSDEQWAQVESTFPQRRGRSGFERKISNRQAFEAGWKRWVKSGVPPRALVASYLEAAERGALDLSLVTVDSTVVRAHQHAAGARKKTVTKPWAVRAVG